MQRLVEGPGTVGETAASLGVTQQAVSKTVRELVDLGYVAQTVDAAGVRRFATALGVLGTALDELGLADAVEQRAVRPPEDRS